MHNNWQKSWKGRIAKFIFETYNNRENDNVSDHFFNLTIDQLLWNASSTCCIGLVCNPVNLVKQP